MRWEVAGEEEREGWMRDGREGERKRERQGGRQREGCGEEGRPQIVGRP